MLSSASGHEIEIQDRIVWAYSVIREATFLYQKLIQEIAASPLSS